MTLVIDTARGTIAGSSWSVGPGTSREAFLRACPSAEEWVINEPWHSWRIREDRWSVVIYFNGKALIQADLVWLGPIDGADETVPDYEKRRHAFHRSTLSNWMGSRTPTDKIASSWGEVRAFIDERSSAFIRITWLQQTSRPVPG